MGHYTSRIALSGGRSNITITIRHTFLTRIHRGRVPLSTLGTRTGDALVNGLNVRCACTSRRHVRTAVPISRHAHRPFKVLRNNTALTLTRAITKLNSVMVYGPSRFIIKVRMDNGRVSSTRRNSAIHTITAVMRGNHSSRM